MLSKSINCNLKMNDKRNVEKVTKNDGVFCAKPILELRCTKSVLHNPIRQQPNYNEHKIKSKFTQNYYTDGLTSTIKSNSLKSRNTSWWMCCGFASCNDKCSSLRSASTRSFTRCSNNYTPSPHSSLRSSEDNSADVTPSTILPSQTTHHSIVPKTGTKIVFYSGTTSTIPCSRFSNVQREYINASIKKYKSARKKMTDCSTMLCYGHESRSSPESTNNICVSKSKTLSPRSKSEVRSSHNEVQSPLIPNNFDSASPHKTSDYKTVNSDLKLESTSEDDDDDDNADSYKTPIEPLSTPFYDSVKETTTNTTWNLSAELDNLTLYGWYWGPMSRTEAEESLAGQLDGTFLVRDSSDERHLLSLSFRSFGKTLHTRIEHTNGAFSLYSQQQQMDGSLGEGFSSVRELIDSSVADSRDGAFCYSRARTPGSSSFPVQLIRPLSRFNRIHSLQHLSRFVIRKCTRIDLLGHLPVPPSIRAYLQERQY